MPPYDGNGTYNLPSTTVTPAIADTTIDEVGMNSFTDDVETALSQCVTNDGQTTNPRIDAPYFNEAVAMTSTSTELNLLDGATVTTAEINNIDGGAADASTTIVDADQIIINNGGTMEQTAVTDLDTYLSATTKTLTNKTLTAPTVTTGTFADPAVTVSGTGTIADSVNSTSIDAIYDTDAMTEDDANGLATQQSIKAYVDSVPRETADTVQATTSGTTKDFTIPSGVKSIQLVFANVSCSAATGALGVRLGDSGGIDTTYVSISGNISGSTASELVSTSSIVIAGVLPSATYYYNGIVTLTNLTGNVWVATSTVSIEGGISNNMSYGCATHTLASGELTTVQLYHTDTFDAGQVNVLYETTA